MENENLVANVTEEAIENDVLTEDLGNKKILKVSIIALCVGGVAAGVVAIARKYKDKIEAARVKKEIKDLESKGYTVIDSSCDAFDEEDAVKDLDE